LLTKRSKLTTAAIDKCPTHLVLGVLNSILAQELKLSQLKKLIGVRNSIESCAKVLEGLLVANRHEGSEGIALASAIRLRFEEGQKQLGRIWDESFGVLEDGSNCPGGVLAHIGVAVFQARAGRGKEGFDEFGFAQLAQEAESVSSDVFIGVLQVVADAVAKQGKKKEVN
jgi:hypothetical protein